MSGLKNEHPGSADTSYPVEVKCRRPIVVFAAGAFTIRTLAFSGTSMDHLKIAEISSPLIRQDEVQCNVCTQGINMLMQKDERW